MLSLVPEARVPTRTATGGTGEGRFPVSATGWPGRGGLRRRHGGQRGGQDRDTQDNDRAHRGDGAAMGSLVSDIVPFPPWSRSVKYDKS
jgi:hypothetical protein